MKDIFSSNTFPDHYVLTICNEGEKCNTCPFQFEDELTTKVSGKPKSITGTCRERLLIEVSSKEQGEKLMSIVEITSKFCKMREHEFFNVAKGMIYVHNNEVLDLNSFQQGLKDQFQVW